MNSSKHILVLGGSGTTGRELVKIALQRGYKVRSLTRDVSKVPKFKEGEVEWHVGSVFDQKIVDKAVEGQDAIISFLGPSGLGATTIYSESARIIVNAMKKHNVKRFLALTPGMYSPRQNCLKTSFLNMILKNLRADAENMKNFFKGVNDREIEWTVVQPFHYTNSPITGKYKVSIDVMEVDPHTGRADLADFLLKESAENKWVGQAVYIGY